MCIVLCTWLSTLLALSMPMKNVANNKIEEKTNDSIVVETTVVEKENNTQAELDSIKNELILEVERYIYGNFPKAHKTIPSSIVKHGLENNLDIVFMMAQTQLETSFGTLGAGRPTSRRSLFGVALRRYGSYEEAIADYIAILKKSYLTRGRTEQHLMNKYRTTRGGRYAQNPKYEVELKGTYAKINKKTNIKQLQHKFKTYEEKTKTL